MDQVICGFRSRLSHEAFPRGFPTGLSHVPPLCESIIGLKFEAVQGKQVSLEWTETSEGLREWSLPLELGGGIGAPLDVGGTLVLPLEWRRVCRGTS